MRYFNNANTLEELRKQYKELLKKYHPDNKDGSTEATQEINAEYEKLFKALKNRHEQRTADDNKTSYDNMKYDFAEDEQLRKMLQRIIHFSSAMIEICGSWLWVFNSYEYHKELKEMGFKYAPKKKAWYWHSEAFRKKGKKVLSMEAIRDFYGSTEIQTEGRKQLKQA